MARAGLARGKVAPRVDCRAAKGQREEESTIGAAGVQREPKRGQQETQDRTELKDTGGGASSWGDRTGLGGELPLDEWGGPAAVPTGALGGTGPLRSPGLCASAVTLVASSSRSPAALPASGPEPEPGVLSHRRPAGRAQPPVPRRLHVFRFATRGHMFSPARRGTRSRESPARRSLPAPHLSLLSPP